MNLTTQDKQELIKKIFSDVKFFEKKILDVESDNDRAEIMKILSESLVHDTLKEEINFLYLIVFSDFTLKPIPNIIFKELASEWVIFAEDMLHMDKDQALKELQDKGRVQFILTIVHNYLRKYKHFIFEEIADTFIELIDRIPNARKSNAFVEEVLNSNFIVNQKLLHVRDFRELWRRVRAARNLKNTELNVAHAKVNDTKALLLKKDISYEKKEALKRSLFVYETELEKLNKTPLDHFEDTVKKVKESMINSMMQMKI